MGGLGITSAHSVALSAFLASLTDTIQLHQALVGQPHINSIISLVDHNLRLWNTQNQSSLTLDQITAATKTQQYLTTLVHKRTIEELSTVNDFHFRVIFTASRMEHSSEWITALPLKHEGLFMDSNAFRMALRFRLGVPICQNETRCSACNAIVDIYGKHFTICKAIHHGHHNAICRLLSHEAQRAHLSPILEPRNLVHVDILIPVFHGGRDTCIDVSIVSSFTDISRAISEIAYNAKRMESRKREKYEYLVTLQGLFFIPFVMESLGGFGPQCSVVIDKIGRALADVDHIRSGSAKSRLRVKLQFKWMSLLGNCFARHLFSQSQM